MRVSLADLVWRKIDPAKSEAAEVFSLHRGSIARGAALEQA
jgi:hypothetical protein